MSAQLNHTIVRSHHKAASAAFLADILGIQAAPPWGPFVPVPLDRDLILEFLQVGPDEELQSQHYGDLPGR